MAITSRKRRLFIKPEADDAYGAEAGATDGSDFTAVQTVELGMPEDLTELIETGYFTGRNADTPSVLGPSGGEIPFTMPAHGLLTAAADGGSVPAVDAQDMLLVNAFGDSANTQGEGVGVGSTVSNLVLDTNVLGLQDLAAVIANNTAGTVMQWRRTGNAASPYSLNRDWPAALVPADSGTCYGVRHYRPIDEASNDSLSAMYDLDGTIFDFLGGRLTSLKLNMTVGQKALLSGTLKFDSIAENTSGRTAIPTIDAFAGTPIMGQLGSFSWGNTEYAAKSVEIDFGLQTVPDDAFSGANGRSNIRVMATKPVITIEPAFSVNFITDKLANTRRNLGVKLGSGALSGSIVNSYYFFAESAEISALSSVDDAGRLRQSVSFMPKDSGIFSGSTLAHLWQLGRA